METNAGADDEQPSPPVPATMRAAVQRRYGDSDTIAVETIDVPVPGADEVLIEVQAAGVDRGVWHLMAGLPYLVRITGYGLTAPKTPVPGLDVSGRVAAVGREVSRFAVGDAVFGFAKGSFAEYAVAVESKLAHKPGNVGFEQAAVAANSGITALQALTKAADVQPGQQVLVIGASGGVGSFTVQLARALGAEVTGVARAAKSDLVLELGAVRAVDYANADYLDGSTRYDLIIDTGGLNPIRSLRRALAPKGTLVIVGGEGGNRLTGGVERGFMAMAISAVVPQRLTTFIAAEHHRWIDELARYMADGSVVSAVGASYTLDQVPQALADLAAGKTRGKSVIRIGDEDS